MAFGPSRDAVMLGESLERYLRESYSHEQRYPRLKAGDAFSREHWNFLAELGLLGLPLAEASGGFGGTLADVAHVAQRLGQGLVLEPYFECIVLAGRLLEASGEGAARTRTLAALIAGEELVSLAHFERGDRGRGEVRLTRLAEGGRLEGAKLLVAAPPGLAAMLVTARDPDGALGICLVRADAPGVTIRRYAAVDGRSMAEVRFEGVMPEGDARLAYTDPSAALDAVLTYADAVLCAEAAGCMHSLLEMTVLYAQTRKQFGRPIGSFQALKHRLVDCHSSLEQSLGLVQLAADDASPAWRANVAAARSFIGRHAVQLGHEAIHVHGGMGMTDELAVSHYHKRLTMIAMSLGDPATQTDRHIALRGRASRDGASTALEFERMLAPPELAFRAEVREFLAARLTAEIRAAVRCQTGTYPERGTVVAWQRQLNARGWLAPHFPVALGGTGWSALQRFLFEYECAVGGAPEQHPMGNRYVGPVIAHFGSDWQKAHFLPKILSSEHYWCQGFSEPGAGSDLSALALTAVRDGDEYVLNGSKMWTTHAHYANWCFVLARTERTAKPQEGVSFILVELASPGVKIEPIPLLAVDKEVNQVFFTDVRVPARHLVGESGRGWEYAKFLLELERGGSCFCGRMRHEAQLLRELTDTLAPQLWQDRVFMHRLAALEQRLMALEMIEFRGARAMDAGEPIGVRGSLTKLLGSYLQEDITELGMEVAGYGGAEMIPWRPLGGPGSKPLPAFDLEAVAMSRYLNMRATSIYGGSNEIQREILARQVLGLR